MNKIRTAVGSIGFVTYGWALYVSYWARPTIIWHKIRELEWKAHLFPTEETEKELKAWQEWRKMTFLEQLLRGPPRKHYD